MASVLDLWTTIVNAITAETRDYQNVPNVFIDSPTPKMVQDLQGGGPPLVSVFDKDKSQNKTRWGTISSKPNLFPTGINSFVSTRGIPTGQTATITITGVPNANDAISCVLRSQNITQSSVVSAAGGDTTTTLAVKLAAAINANPDFSTWATAVSAQNVVTITALLPLYLHSRCGNIGKVQREAMRLDRPLKIQLFANAREDRDGLGEMLLEWCAKAQSRVGLTLPDGTWTRITCSGDKVHQEKINDVWQWDFFITCNYGVTYMDLLYSVLAEMPTISNDLPVHDLIAGTTGIPAGQFSQPVAVPFFGEPYGVIASGNWAASFSAPLLQQQSCSIRASAAAPSNPIGYYAAFPASIANGGILPVSGTTVAIPIPGAPNNIVVLTPSWTTKMMIASVAADQVTVGFNTAAPTGGTISFFFPEVSGLAPVAMGQSSINVQIPPGNWAPFVIANWSAITSVSLASPGVLTVTFDSPAPANALLNWGLIPLPVV